MKQYHIVDLFAGVGGLSYGFSQLPGFRILAANEIEKDIAAAYSLNHPGVKMLNCDIADLTKERLAGALGGQQVDIVVGGPPCQSYSTLGKRRMDDRANLFLQYKRILQILQPQAFIFENVTGILQRRITAACSSGWKASSGRWATMCATISSMLSILVCRSSGNG